MQGRQGRLRSLRAQRWWHSIGAALRRLTIGSSDRGAHLRWAKEEIDDLDQLPAF